MEWPARLPLEGGGGVSGRMEGVPSNSLSMGSWYRFGTKT